MSTAWAAWHRLPLLFATAVLTVVTPDCGGKSIADMRQDYVGVNWGTRLRQFHVRPAGQINARTVQGRDTLIFDRYGHRAARARANVPGRTQQLGDRFSCAFQVAITGFEGTHQFPALLKLRTVAIALDHGMGL